MQPSMMNNGHYLRLYKQQTGIVVATAIWVCPVDDVEMFNEPTKDTRFFICITNLFLP